MRYTIVDAGSVANTFGTISLFAVLIGLCINFLPSALAVLKGNVYKGQIIKYQLIVVAINVLVSVGASIITSIIKGKVIRIICLIGSGIWSIIAIVLWFYILIHALRDQQMTLLSRFGINV